MSRKINILHVLNIDISRNRTNGVAGVVPQYVNSEAPYANVAIYNYKNMTVKLDPRVVVLGCEAYPDCKVEAFPEPFNRPDLVIIHDLFCNLGFNKLARRLYKQGIPYIVVPHGCFTQEALSRKRLKKRVAMHTVFHTLIYKASAVQYLCEHEKENSFLKENAIIANNGVNVKRLISGNKGEGAGINFVYIGRKYIQYKGIDYLLEACALAKDTLIKEHVKVKLYGPDRRGSFEVIDNMIKQYDIGEVVENLEGVFDEEKERALRAADVFVLPSKSEGQPLGVLEALANGVPVLVTPGTGFVKEVTEHKCGWGVELTAESIAKKMCEIIDHKECLREYGNNAYAYAKETYDWPKVAQRTICTYENLIKENGNESSSG